LYFKIKKFCLKEFIFTIKKIYLNITGKPSFCITRAYRRAAWTESSSLLAPVQTIFPELNIKAVVRGLRIRIITAAKRFGLYSALRA
jgi:hypothetical protein